MKFLKSSLLLGALCALALATSTQGATSLFGLDKGQWTFELGGSGSTTTVGDSQSLFGADLAIGHTGELLLPIEGGLRQGFAYSSLDGGNTILDSHLYLDATLLKVKTVELFAGANIGLTYGNTPLLWSGGPEAGLKWWFKSDVGAVGRVVYPIDITNGRAEDKLTYFLGIEVKF